MVEIKQRRTMMYEAEPTVAKLNRVPGFDPLRYMRRSTEDGKLKLDLKHQILWFRMVYPKGRLEFNYLYLTSTVAVVEAKVYFEPNGMAISNIEARRERGVCGAQYIVEARRAAAGEALALAGFGIQFVDADREEMEHTHVSQDITTVVETPTEQPCQQEMTRCATPPLSAATGPICEEKEAVVEEQSPAPSEEKPLVEQSAQEQDSDGRGTNDGPVTDTPAPKAAEVRQEQKPVEGSGPAAEDNPAQAAPQVEAQRAAGKEPESQLERQEVKVAPDVSSEQTEGTPVTGEKTVALMSMAQNLASRAKEEGQAEEAAPVTVKAESAKAEPVPYNNDMAVEKIVALMSMEQALACIVDVGSRKDERKTVGELLKTAPAVIKWIAYSYTGDNNILRAAATKVLRADQSELAS